MSVVSHATTSSFYSGQKSNASVLSKSYVQDDSIIESSDEDEDDDDDVDSDDDDDVSSEGDQNDKEELNEE